jgi:hypothetical protein
VNAEEARKIWEEEVSSKAQGFLEYIRKMILQYTYQNYAFLYFFEFPDFIKTIQENDEQAATNEFVQAILEKIICYFEYLGFKVKADTEKFKLWIAFLGTDNLKKDSFSEKLINIINARRNYRSSTGNEKLLNDIFAQIREKTRRSRSIKYPLTLNIPNTNTLLLEDLLELIDSLERKGYTVEIEDLVFNNKTLENREDIEKAINEEFCFEKMEINIIIKW